MSEALDVKAEILKLARLLEREPASLSYLDGVPSADLRAFRELVTERLFSAHTGTLSRLAAVSKLVPAAATATIAERAFGPLLSARLAGLLEPQRAAEVAAKLPSAFLADISIEIDPRRASDVIGLVPTERVVEVTSELLARGEYVTMGRFVGHLRPEALVAAVAVMSDRDVLQVAFMIEDKDGLSELAALLTPERLARVVAAAEDDEDLRLEALELARALSLS